MIECLFTDTCDFDYALDKPKTNFIEKSISYSGAKTSNDLPRSFKASNISLWHFKALLRDRWAHGQL